MHLVTKTIDLTGIVGTTDFQYDSRTPTLFASSVATGNVNAPYSFTSAGILLSPQSYGLHGNNEPADYAEAVQMVCDAINGQNVALNGVAVKAVKSDSVLTLIMALTDQQLADGGTVLWYVGGFDDPSKWSTAVLDDNFQLPDPNATHTADLVGIGKAATVAGAKFAALL